MKSYLVPIILLSLPVRSPSMKRTLSRRLSAIEARAGVVVNEDALFGGVSAEGQLGDFKIYNNRVQFIIQGFRAGNYYLPNPGTIVDVDWVRPEGQLGHDPIDEWTANAGVGRLLDAQTVDIIQPGGLNQAAIIRVAGPEVGMGLLEQAIESPGFIRI